MKTTLENLQKAVAENRLRNLAKNIVQYQNFKTNVVVRKIDNAGYSPVTLKFYIEGGIGYIKNGIRYKQAGKLLDYIDDCIAQCVQPLTPKNEEARVLRICKTKKNKCDILPVEKVLKELTEQNTDKTEIMYAIKIGKNIRLLSSIQEANNLKEALFFMSKLEAEIIKINYEIIK